MFFLGQYLLLNNITVMKGIVNCSALLLIAVQVSISTFAQEPRKIPDGTEGVVLTVPPVDSSTKKLPPNEFKGSVTSFRIGLGFIYDVAAYAQSEVFKQQMEQAELEMRSRGKLRDFRVLGSGVLNTKRTLSWKFAYMWDGDKNTWMLRETGITIGVPELKGHFFVGRTKEGYSMVKVMNGHSPWTNERQMALDVIPILADGIKYFGYFPKSRIFMNLGYYNDIVSKGQGFSTFQWQYVARIGWMAINDPTKERVLHIATNLRYGKPLDGKIALKSRPESNPAPQIINTGTFEAEKSNSLGGEIYYRNKQFMVGSEMMVHNFYSSAAGDHQFFGGDVMLSYFFTGAVRPYNTVGSIFGFIPVKKSVFKGGWGEIEGVLHISTLNLNSGSVKGGQFWRITPMINWYMTKIMRMEFIYGYGTLDRFDKTGTVQIFEARIQFTIM
jgi:phosphate-selective porin OprO/OprP